MWFYIMPLTVSATIQFLVKLLFTYFKSTKSTKSHWIIFVIAEACIYKHQTQLVFYQRDNVQIFVYEITLTTLAHGRYCIFICIYVNTIQSMIGD